MINISKAVEVLKAGGVVAYPTESFFALGADATNVRAVKKVFALKGRGKKPIALIASSIRQVKYFFHVTDTERKLMEKFWPGAVTILLKPKAPTPSNSPSGRGRGIAADVLLGTTPRRAELDGAPPTSPPQAAPLLSLGGEGGGRRGRYGIGVRVPGHALARRLALALGRPITATSANLSGKNPKKLHTVVTRTFRGIVIVDGRCGAAKKPSTIVEVHRDRTYVVRKGSVTIK